MSRFWQPPSVLREWPRDVRETVIRALGKRQAEIEHWVEREAAACPEGQSFEETMGALRAEVEKLRNQVEARGW